MSNTDSKTNQPRLLSFTLDGWSVLGGRVTVPLHDGVAVLVGRNGSGKSAIIEGFEAISLCAIGKSNRVPYNNSDSIPKILEIEILTPDKRHLAYKYERIPLFTSTESLDLDDSISDNLGEKQFSWHGYCQYVDGNQETIWTTENGITTLINEHGQNAGILGNIHLFPQSILPENSSLKFPREMFWIYDVLNGVRVFIKTTISSRKNTSIKVLRNKNIVVADSLGIAGLLTQKIHRCMDMGSLNELESICQRVGIANKITEQKFYENGENKRGAKNGEYYFSILLDDVNIGLVSDGTLKVLSILIEIIDLKTSSTIVIEEPETQIHPAMLAKLLSEIETYTYGENLILSTHSPQVVSWTIPEKINLVHRKDGQTFVRKLGEAQIHNVIEYLSEEGDLGEWIYSGILDDE
ncbi:AAA family ATPase [Pseudanabaena sp. 'Roaring Creek']|uniref:AAA family ATPase n=1 Tax=Pseudanabaena sp. 'Roaring Creek' TaxID=1681830 RepID=UPI0006D7EF6C|nr:ATP-binding protein [Pseudanabaena sp. 'Roaring Creek']